MTSLTTPRTNAETKARLLSEGDWGKYGSSEMTRYSKPRKRPGRRPLCIQTETCTNPCTHVGFANGVALMQGCEFHVAQWVRDGWPA
jgi:hypothetical protein